MTKQRRDWAGERGDYQHLSEAEVRGADYVGERPLDGGEPGAACSYPYMLEEKRPEAPLFEGDYRTRFDKIVSRYPDSRGALLPTLNLAQEVRGWISAETMDRVAELLDLSPVYVRGVATFYTMYNKRPVGRHLIQVCTNVCCNVCGADQVMESFLEHTGTEAGEISEDGLFTVIEAECLGACGFPTAVQINSRYYENVVADDVPAILEDLCARDGRGVEPWRPQIELHEPVKDPATAVLPPSAEQAGRGARRPPPDRASPAKVPGAGAEKATQGADTTTDAPGSKGVPGGGVGTSGGAGYTDDAAAPAGSAQGDSDRTTPRRDHAADRDDGGRGGANRGNGTGEGR